MFTLLTRLRCVVGLHPQDAIVYDRDGRTAIFRCAACMATWPIRLADPPARQTWTDARGGVVTFVRRR